MSKDTSIKLLTRCGPQGDDRDRQQEIAPASRDTRKRPIWSLRKAIEHHRSAVIMLKIHKPRRKQRRRNTTKITVGAKQITVKAHSMSSDWAMGLGTGIIASILGAFVFGNYTMAFAGIILILCCNIWYAASRWHWQRTVVKPAIERAARTATRKPRTRKATP